MPNNEGFGIKITAAQIVDLAKVSKQIQSELNTIKNLKVDINSVNTTGIKTSIQTAIKEAFQSAKVGKVNVNATANVGKTSTTGLNNTASQIERINKAIASMTYDAKIARLSEGFKKTSLSAKEVSEKIETVQKAYNKLKDPTNKGDLVKNFNELNNILNKTQNELNIAQIEAKQYIDTFKKAKLKNDIETWLKNNTAATKEAKIAMRMYLDEINRGDITPFREKEIRSGMGTITNEMRQMNKLGKSTIETFTSGAKSFIEWSVSSGAVMEVVNNLRLAVKEINNLDDILTEISKTSDLTEQQLKKLGMASYDTASKYGRKASDYLSGVQSMSQSGFYGKQGEAMAEQSLLAQAAGDMSQEVADSYILATNAAYKFNGEASKLNAVLDGQNSISNQNSVALQDMAVAMSEAGTVASSYNVAIEDLSAMVGTIESVTKAGGDEVGNSIKSILINLQNVSSSKITGTLDKANASMTEFVNGSERLRNPIEILRDLAETFNNLDEDDPLRAEILTNVAGKYQASKLAALLQNMEMFDKMLVDYAEGEGSAFVEAQKSATNLTGSLNTLSNSWNEFVNSLVTSDGLITAVNLINDLLQGVTDLGALGTIGVGAGLFAGIKNVGKYTRVRMFQNCFEYAYFA